jgi:CubicO group peptidase (beta-lactamase class C family)
MLKIFILVIAVLLMSANPSLAQTPAPNRWQPVTDIIDKSELDEFVVIVGDKDRVLLTHTKGAFVKNGGADLVVPIASSTKWLTAATIMTLVEEGKLALTDKPQKYISWWTTDAKDQRSQITLAQLLSFTSGLAGEPLCLFNPKAVPEECARDVYNNQFKFKPGSTFFYSSTHMHIAGVMASQATGKPFSQLFREQIADPLKMSRQTRMVNVGDTNPFLAGGANSSANDYAKFLQALLNGQLLAKSRETMFRDWTPAPVKIAYSPVGNYWHYGLGTWRECYDTSWTTQCAKSMIVSGGGGLGWFPWIDLDKGYYGLIARWSTRGAVGPSIELSVELRPHIEKAIAQKALASPTPKP